MSTNEKPQLIFLGKLPPPFIGPSLACQMILNSKLKDEFNLIHLNTSDHRDISTLGKIDFGNSYLAIKQYFMLINLLLKYKRAMVYVPAGQTTVGYIRDAIFIVIAKMFGRKVITHLRGGNFLNWYNSAPNYAKWVVRKVHSKVDAQIILGNNLRPLFNWLLPEDRIHVIPNGGNYTIPKVNRMDDKIVILFLGNFIGTKGVLQVLYASEYLADIKDKIERLKIEPRKTNGAHLLHGKLAGKWSCWLGSNIRMIYIIDDRDESIIIEAVGSHKIY